VNQGASDATTQEHSNTTVDVVLCVIEMNEEEKYKDGEFDSSNKVVELKFEEESFGNEDVIEIFNEDGIVEQEEEYEYVLTTGLLSFPSSTKLLNDSIAVADTGSTANLSGSKRGATNIIQTAYGNNNKHSTQDASGRDLQVKMIYDLNCMFTDTLFFLKNCKRAKLQKYNILQY
jgi:hypothetical protein